jgi:NADPH2:quinone reductase
LRSLVAEDGELRLTLSQRVAAEITTTFASHYTREITLAEALEPEIIRAYYRRATGEKFLIVPGSSPTAR